MPDSSTTYFSLIKPEVGSSRDSWGGKWNGNLDQLDQIMAALMPIGAMLDFAGANAPPGWLLADGSVVSIATYPRLFAVLGTRYGGDGASNFGLPDTRARALVGVGSTTDLNGSGISYSLGQRYGYIYSWLGQAQMPNYALYVSYDGAHVHTGWTSADGNHSHNGWTDTQGYHAHNTNLWNMGTGAGAGPYTVMSDVFGGRGYASDGAGSHAHNVGIDVQGNHQHQIQTYDGQGAHSHAVYLNGSGQPITMINPLLAVTKIIFAGPPGHQQSANAAGALLEAHLLAAPRRGTA